MELRSDYVTPKLLIDGHWRSGTGAGYSTVVNPATEEVLAMTPHASDDELDETLVAVEKGFAVWRNTVPAIRSAVILRAVALMRDRKESIACALTLEQGKPIGQARAEVEVAADMVQWYGEQAKRIYGRIFSAPTPNTDFEVRKEAVGPCLLLSPWNVPVILAARKIAGALAAGCSCIVKPPEETPGAVAMMVSCFVDAGLPDGVINLVNGEPAHVSERLIRSDVIRKVSFTGSVAIGKQIARLASDGLKRVTLELGGHSPVIVYDDVDVAGCVRLLATAKFRNAGQLCHAPTRFFVHRRIYERFVDRFSDRAKQLRVGNGLDASTEMGPLANQRRLQAVSELVEATSEMGTVVAGGKRVGRTGFFYAPTVIADVRMEAKGMNEEPFGPIALISPFSTDDEVIAKANATRYGLASYVFTDSAATQRRLIESLHVGSVAINNTTATVAEAPFGGVRDSGYGYESGEEGLEGYLHTKLVHRTYSTE
ncbi:NAD-dependent succinate-semialdehyde dehydrogenase [Burkholderia diffusa]|uniref:NAD-dependent succinate-semialdehyde dehydrogenase n=1 Tax=Burkholderia diffusa TaxID=488732 RepID=A0AAW3PB99_9BURK|nr:NAD-dependent succinate-semialdehyde dehydrogenase [Burkholderia diffusa]KWF32776.1 NAD-dependent succinate-semialdehyde dehydrogenase [Burkholderia diffusa]KWF38698.1 NAD-dependent succinate-semialdehyde dehydrogenase [Burkholderia diffusa]KWF46743.1 NAD-dependent succinate-semialdehyde dehydrogenase [Burkholderia diffusa]KWF50686.1 NAD-dependent succinate-semialdehyde dehydrogenase [Burkholderia diffusa]